MMAPSKSGSPSKGAKAWEAARVLRFMCENCDLPEDRDLTHVEEWWIDTPQENTGARLLMARCVDESVARRIVQAINAHDALVEALRACMDYIPGSTIRSWPPGFELRDKALKLGRAALSLVGGPHE